MSTEHDYVTRAELENTENRLSKDIHENREIINAHSKDIVRLDTLYKSLEGLPAAITALDKTLVQMSANMNAMKEQIDSMHGSINSLKTSAEQRDERISKIDNKSKVDWQTAVTDNFWKIVSACLGAAFVLKLLIENFGG